MVYGAIDLHMRYSQIRIVDDGRAGRARAARRDERRASRRGRSAATGRCGFCSRPGRRVSGSRRSLETAGHTVIVADPNYAPMYGEIRRKVKTDRRDVAALAEANRRGWYRATHRVSAAQRALRQLLRSRRLLVQMRSGTIALIRVAAAAVRLSARAAAAASACRARLAQLGAAGRAGGDDRAAAADGRRR